MKEIIIMKNKKKLILNILLIIFSCTFVISISYIVFSIYQYKKSENYYKNIKHKVVLDNDISGDSEDVIDEKLLKKSNISTEKILIYFKSRPPIKIDFKELKKINKDIKGWIYMPDSMINYPVVQGDDNSFYLHHLLDKSYSYPGTIFIDSESDPEFSQKNSIIYGHNMKNSTMFAALINYNNQDYYEKHPVLFYLTPEKNYRLDIYSGFVTHTSSKSYQVKFKDEKAYDSMLDSVINQSRFRSIIEKEDIDRTVTLSTCAYDFTNARYVLHCNLVEL